MIGISLNINLLLIFYVVICVILPMLFLVFLKNGKAKTAVLSIFLTLYFLLVLAITVANITISNGMITIQYNYDIEFNEKIINANFSNISIIDVIIDLVLLIPVGMIFAYFFKHLKPMTAILICWYFGFAFGFIFELLQFIVPVTRGVAVHDAIFNMISLFVGGLLGRMFVALSNKTYKKE